MHTTEAFAGLACLDCESAFGPEISHRCPDCGGPLAPTYDEDALTEAHTRLFSDSNQNTPEPTQREATQGLGRFAPVLPFPTLPSLAEGSTPLVDCPTLTDAYGVGRVLLKDEGRNATGGLVDRELVLAVEAARQHGATTVALPTTGNAGQAAAAYAARAGLELEAFVPSRSTFDTKAMINVHGGEMSVVGGRYPDAVGAFESEREATERADDEGWYSLAPFETPYRHEGSKTLAYELVETLGEPPDALVVPTGHGTELVGLYRGFEELVATDTIASPPRLYVAQPADCAPVVDAWETGGSVAPVEYPDTICGTLEIPDPAGGSYVLDALDATDGGAVAPTDHASLDAALALAGNGVPVSATGGVGVAGLALLAENGAFDPDETVVLVDPATANRETDLLRSRLMSKGI